MTAPASDPVGPGPGTADFTLPNGGPGPDPLTLSELDADLAVVLFHRDHLCGNCRKQAVRMAKHRDEFEEREAAIVSILPEPIDRVAKWAENREAPFPTLADPDNAIAERYGQPTRFGALGRRIDLLGRMPLVALVDLRTDPEVLWRHAGRTPGDRPSIEELLTRIETFS